RGRRLRGPAGLRGNLAGRGDGRVRHVGRGPARRRRAGGGGTHRRPALRLGALPRPAGRGHQRGRLRRRPGHPQRRPLPRPPRPPQPAARRRLRRGPARRRRPDRRTPLRPPAGMRTAGAGERTAASPAAVGRTPRRLRVSSSATSSSSSSGDSCSPRIGRPAPRCAAAARRDPAPAPSRQDRTPPDWWSRTRAAGGPVRGVRGAVRDAVDGARMAVGTLTAVPVRVDRVDRAVAGWAMALAPAVGAGLGAAGAAVFAAALLLRAGGPLSAVLALGLLALLTRALHLDGLADLADGLGSGRPAEEALAVMKRSDIGPFGVVALVFAVLV